MADTGVLLIKSLDKGFVIHGDTIKILQNRFAMMYLRRNLHHSVSGADIVIEDVTDINTIMSHVSVLAKYGKCEIHFDENVSEEIKHMKIGNRALRSSPRRLKTFERTILLFLNLKTSKNR